MAEKRIINLTEATELSGGDYLVVDSASSGTRKVSGSVINSAIGEVASDLDTLSARVDQIIAPSGEAPSAAEVSDARVGADGVTYTTLGGAIRTQVTDLKSDLSDETSARILLAGRVTTAESDIDTLETHKVAQPLDGNNQPTNGTSGQSLRTKGNGTTEWADVGLPTDAQTAQAVSNWLDEHPEATTTVQDGAITKTKLANSLARNISNKINAVEYGFIADGVTDNSAIMQSYLSNDSAIPIYFPEGLYAFDSPIVLTDCFISLDENASWIYTGETTEDVFVHIQPDARVLNRYLVGGSIYANGCGIGIAENNTRFLRIENISVYNFTDIGIVPNYSEGTGNGSGCYMNNIYICGYDGTNNEDVGLDISNCNDSRFNNIVIQDAKIGIYTNGGNNKCHNIHHWVSSLQKYIGSITVKCTEVSSGAIVFDNLTCDTIQTCIKGYSGSRVIINGIYYFSNPEVVPASDSQTYPVCIFDVVSTSIILINGGLLDCFNVYGQMCSSASYEWSETGKVDIDIAFRSDGHMTNVISRMSPITQIPYASDLFTIKSGWKFRNVELFLDDKHLSGTIVIAKTDESAIGVDTIYSLLTNKVAFAFGLHTGVVLSDKITGDSQTTTVTTAFIPNSISGTTNVYCDNATAKYIIVPINVLLS